SQIEVGGIHFDQTTTYRLANVTEAAATVDVDVVMKAASQALSVEPNATTTVTSASSHGTGQSVIPLHGLVATGTLTATAETNLAIVRGPQRILSSMQLDTIASVKAIHPDATP